MALVFRNLPANVEAVDRQVWSLGSRSVFLPGKFHGQEPSGVQFMGLQRVGHS